MKKNDWKERLNIVYSTNPDFSYETEEENVAETLPPSNNASKCNWIERTEEEK